MIREKKAEMIERLIRKIINLIVDERNELVYCSNNKYINQKKI